MIKNLFISVIEISLWVSVIIVLLKITSPFIKKNYAAKWRYIIWFILAVRLAVPINITLPFAPVKFIIFEQAQQITAKSAYSLIEIAAFIWLLGMIGFAIYQFVLYKYFTDKMKRWSITVTDKRTGKVVVPFELNEGANFMNRFD